MKFTIFILLACQVLFAQTVEENELMIEGEKAFTENNFVIAKENYSKVTRLNPKNKDAWFNLAATEINLGESEIACEHFYKVYILTNNNDNKVVELIKEHCPNFRDGTIMSINDVEEKPKFIYQEKEYFLFENKLLNPLYLKLLIKELKKSKLLKDKLNEKALVQISINKDGKFDGKVFRVGAKEEDVEIVKIEIQKLMSNLVIYIPAKNKGINVDLWEKPILPIRTN